MLIQVENEVTSILEGIAKLNKKQGGFSDHEWTRRIKEGLCKLGKNKGYGVSAAGCAGADTGEWLFDFVWADGQEQPEKFTEMPLIMECEWGQKFDDIAWDFEKLLVAKASLKVMVFQQPSGVEVNEIIIKLKKSVAVFKACFPGERYFFAGYAYDECRFYFDSMNP